ncbi:hypothetical protein HMPREF3034_02541 [Prevotella sp. DNF00663]|nr:hypothetical protein HMPREF3034_02541 [Prevotella sp. DNF00663]
MDTLKHEVCLFFVLHLGITIFILTLLQGLGSVAAWLIQHCW